MEDHSGMHPPIQRYLREKPVCSGVKYAVLIFSKSKKQETAMEVENSQHEHLFTL